MFKGMYKLIILKELSKNDLSGYDIIKKIESLKGKKPSTGYIYPILKDLSNQSYISFKTVGRKKVYKINVKGKKFLKELDSKKKNLISTFFKLDSNINFKNNKHDVLNFCFHNNTIKKILFYKTKIESSKDKIKIKKSDKILEDALRKLEKL